MKDLDLNLLRILVAIERSRHLGRAAESLGLSQSGLSTALARLREQLNDELFVRSANGMRPTARALAFVSIAHEVLQKIDEAQSGVREFSALTSSAKFRIAMSDVAELIFIPSLLEHLAREAPQTSVQLAQPEAMPMQERFASGDIDLAVGHFPSLDKDPYFRQSLFSQTYACIVRKNHPALPRDITRAQYQSFGHAIVAMPSRSNAALDQSLDRLRISRRVILRTPHHLSLAAIIARSDLIATIPLGAAIEFSRTHPIRVVALPFRPPVFTVYQYWHRRTHREAAAQWLRTQMRLLFNPRTDPYAQSRKDLYSL